MSKAYFSFKQFTLCQSQCGMKVGTDGTLLGAWASGGEHILDVGTGTGLVALMMAQRYPGARVTAIDIDPLAVSQARQNVAASPFADRVEVLLSDVRHHGLHAPVPYDAIVANPPYFEQSLTSPDAQRTMARHTATLSYRELAAAAWRLLTDGGVFSVVIPQECRSRMMGEALLAGFSLVGECGVKTTPRKPVRRCLLAFAKHPAQAVQRSEEVLQLADGSRSKWYDCLTRDFYLEK